MHQSILLTNLNRYDSMKSKKIYIKEGESNVYYFCLVEFIGDDLIEI